MSVPADLQYTVEHEWLRLSDGAAVVGVTAFATDALGEVVYLDLPPVGTPLQEGASCGEVESTKSVSDVYAPADGKVVEVNQAVLEEPGLVNSDPYGAGWLFRMSVSKVPDLLDAVAYEAHTGQGA